jgi:hypothetical protein
LASRRNTLYAAPCNKSGIRVGVLRFGGLIPETALRAFQPRIFYMSSFWLNNIVINQFYQGLAADYPGGISQQFTQ